MSFAVLASNESRSVVIAVRAAEAAAKSVLRDLICSSRAAALAEEEEEEEPEGEGDEGAEEAEEEDDEDAQV